MGKTRRQDDPFVRQVVSKQGKSMVYIYMGMRIGNGHKLPPSPAGAMFGSPLQITSSVSASKSKVYIRKFGIGTRYHQILRVQCVAPRCRRPALLNTIDKRRLCQIGASPVAKQVERHHFYCLQIAARNAQILFDFFDFFNFSILDPPTGHPPTSTHSFDIQTHFVAQ